MPSPSFSSCWKLLGFLLESILRPRCVGSPSPRLRTEMDDSVRKGAAKGPAMAGLRLPGGGGGRWLYFQSSAPAVVIWLAMRRSGGRLGLHARLDGRLDGRLDEQSGAGAEDAVVTGGRA